MARLLTMCVNREKMKREIESRATPSTIGKTTRMERCIAIWKKLQQFQKLRTIYMPHLSVAVEALEDEQGRPQWQEAEEIPLYLPSSLDTQTRTNVCPAKIIAIKERLREAQATQALDDLRRKLRARVFANKFKIKNVTGQTNSTRACAWQKTIDQNAIIYKHTYQRARRALLVLRGHGEWSEKVLRELKTKDVRAFNERAMTAEEVRERIEARRVAGLYEEEVLAVPADGVRLGEGTQSLSWIWYSMGTIGLRMRIPRAVCMMVRFLFMGAYIS